ncbi:GDSL-type esterase/lipase family protein [Clostridium perfringens]|nr:GDSL-type esterase/lipase family protein [Clostridium perfringens]
MKEIIVNVDSYNENSIRTVEGDNLSEVYKIYILKNKRRIDLTNKIAVMAYVDEYGSKRSNILNLNITNAAEGEIELPITNIISEHNGVYACQIAIYGENNSLEQTAPFSLVVENNIFSKISNTAINSSDFHILIEAIKTTNTYGEKLKEGTENIELQYAKKLNEKLDKDGIVTMANMGQDVKEAMTGGSVAIVGKNAVNTINLRNKSITFDKLDSNLQALYSRDFTNIDINWTNGQYMSSDGSTRTAEGYSYTKIDVAGGQEYYIKGKHMYKSVCFLIKNERGEVILKDKAQDSTETIVEEKFVIPDEGTELYINKYKETFEFLKEKSKINLDFKDNIVPYESLKQEVKNKIDSNLKNKLIAFNGDSICEGIGNGGGYAKILKEITGCCIENRAVSGGTIAKNSVGRHVICEDIVNMSNEADIVCLEGGVNDYWQNIPMGTIKPMSDFTGSLDKNTVLGALESSFRSCMDKWLGVPIVFIIIHPAHDVRYINNTQGYNFNQLAEKMKEVCKKYSIVVIDLLNESGGFNGNVERIAKKFTINGGDGTHPTEEGYKKYYVPQIKAKLETLISE